MTLAFLSLVWGRVLGWRRGPCSRPISDAVLCTGAALGPLLAGLISPTGWNNVFYMLIAADVLACLVRVWGHTDGKGEGSPPSGLEPGAPKCRDDEDHFPCTKHSASQG